MGTTLLPTTRLALASPSIHSSSSQTATVCFPRECRSFWLPDELRRVTGGATPGGGPRCLRIRIWPSPVWPPGPARLWSSARPTSDRLPKPIPLRACGGPAPWGGVSLSKVKQGGSEERGSEVPKKDLGRPELQQDSVSQSSDLAREPAPTGAFRGDGAGKHTNPIVSRPAEE